MSDVVIASNTSLKVSRAISGATTVAANCYAVVNYQKTGIDYGSTSAQDYGSQNPDIIVRYFGPGQSVPATFTSTSARNPDPGFFVTAHFALMSGVEFINSP